MSKNYHEIPCNSKSAKTVSVDTVTEETVGITMVNIVMSVNNLCTKKATYNFLCTTHTLPLVLQS